MKPNSVSGLIRGGEWVSTAGGQTNEEKKYSLLDFHGSNGSLHGHGFYS